MQTKFKVGDKVRAINDCGWSTQDDIYTISQCWYSSDHSRCYVRLVEHLRRAPNHSHSADYYELVDPNPVLTPEEVFEHLRKGTKLQFERNVAWVDFDYKYLTTLQYESIVDLVWRIKPEPEVIELNGKRYKLIEE